MTSLIPYRFNRNVARNDWTPFGDDFFAPFYPATRMDTGIRVDVKDEGNHYTLEADMPGMKRENVKVDVEDDVLTIAAELEEKKSEENDKYVYNERRSGTFKRSFTLNGIDEENIHASYEDGVLKLTLPKMVEQPKTGRNIEIQ